MGTLPAPKRHRRHTVATVICHGVAPFEMAVPCEVFGIDRSELGVRQRVLLAQRLLETTDDSVELIALRCGFGTAAGLRLHFRRVLATSPLVYRRTFRRIGA